MLRSLVGSEMCIRDSSKTLCSGYDVDCYETMRDDTCRTEAYRTALAQHSEGRVVLDIGTGALALLAIMAAECGAERVYAVETNQEAAIAARQAVQERGMQTVITVVEGYSTEISLPEKVDLIVHEIFGEIASSEGAAHVLEDAFNRHAKDGAISVPLRARTYIAAAEFPAEEYWAQLDHPMLVDPRATSLKLWNFPPHQVLSEFVVLEEMVFGRGMIRMEQQLDSVGLKLNRTGDLGGFVMYITVSFEAQDSEEINSWTSEDGHWASVYVLFPGVHVCEGDTALLSAQVDIRTQAPSYRFMAAVVRGTVPDDGVIGCPGEAELLACDQVVMPWVHTCIP
eukprot:TRINITY_DN20017_c0_g1_i1.p1 TRINITY_DN20017_c0_g1~~TRINITY_DN20017_c0_g1_i1.p1  ORF type:complete len:340 (-),score=91.02 TRINITY_DN20017_c0_g1_i1:277-1296(-)